MELVDRSTLGERDPIFGEPTLAPIIDQVREFAGSLSIYSATSRLRGVFRSQASRQLLADMFEHEIPQAFGPIEAEELDPQSAVTEILALTRWSNRRLAQIIGISHPTVAAITQGEHSALARSPSAQKLLMDLHQLVTRVAPLAERKGRDLAAVLEHIPSTGRQSPLELLANHEFGKAYLEAMDAMTTRRTSGMMRGKYPALTGNSSVDLTE